MTTPSLVHVVLVRWKPEADPAEVQEVQHSALALTYAIPGILAVHCGPSSSPEGLDGGFDWALVVGFSSSSARDEYLSHPDHQPVAQSISRLAEQVVVFDVDA